MSAGTVPNSVENKNENVQIKIESNKRPNVDLAR